MATRVVISGAGSGIGRAIALRYAREGADVIVSDVDEASAQETVALIERDGLARAYAYQLDVSDAAAWEPFAAGVREDHGVADIVVNNAGILISGTFLDHRPEDWERIIGVNLLGVVHGCRTFGTQMVDAGRRGHIVNIASTAAFAPMRTSPAYATTKAAVLMLSECLRIELASKGIGVTAICPTVIKTNIAEHSSIVGVDADTERQLVEISARLQDRFGRVEPEVVARAVMRAVRRNWAIVPVNPDAWIIYALSRLSPALVRGIARGLSVERSIALAERIFGVEAARETSDRHASAA
jgi:NAD(P)-dependent dehydrogenase (short-subunit alcohol dehydrogenase family)